MENITKVLLAGAGITGAYVLMKSASNGAGGLAAPPPDSNGSVTIPETMVFKVVGDQCYATVTFNNTGGIRFVPKVAFAIRPQPYAETFAATPVDGVEFGPNETQTVTTSSVTIPSGASDGDVWARIQIGTPVGVVITDVEVVDAYTIRGYGAVITGYTFH